MIPRNNLDVDVLVIGAGPAGATVATLVALAGHRVLLLEQSPPRRGGMLELLPPATIHGVFAFTGAQALLQPHEHAESHGATLNWGAESYPWPIQFAAPSRFSRVVPTAYHVERAQVDRALTDAARRQGAEFRDSCEVVDLFEHDGRVAGAFWVASDGVRRRTTSRYVVDATGMDGRLDVVAADGVDGASRHDAFTTLFSYFTGAQRAGVSMPGDSFVAAFNGGEFWCVPFGPSLTGVGVVLRDHVDVRTDADIKQTMQNLLDRCPAAAEYLFGGGPLTAGPQSEAFRRSARTYARTTFWRPGLVRIGEAACAVEPTLGRGIHLATYGALQAARSINTALLDNADESLLFDEFEARYRAEHRRICIPLDELVTLHYDETFNVIAPETGVDATKLTWAAEALGGFSSRDPVLLNATNYRDRRGAPARLDGQDAPGAATVDDTGDSSRDRRLLAVSVDGMRWDTPADVEAVRSLV
ncbi:NAD(P)/FAD-dependent oxidoreductase [Dactylosporangium sp. CA-152071]|uniref:NAD(P)/FAD-dependent oxidoreductase n=1 Tax=Dactylosporangium sp. CA-152071 TaxID=3239933 RepID=UPI003D8CA1BA